MNSTPFLAEEAKYLKEYINKNAALVFEMLITKENTDAITFCLEQMKYADTVFDAGMEVADKMKRTDIKTFLLECKNNGG